MAVAVHAGTVWPPGLEMAGVTSARPTWLQPPAGEAGRPGDTLAQSSCPELPPRARGSDGSDATASPEAGSVGPAPCCCEAGSAPRGGGGCPRLARARGAHHARIFPPRPPQGRRAAPRCRPRVRRGCSGTAGREPGGLPASLLGRGLRRPAPGGTGLTSLGESLLCGPGCGLGLPVCT